MQKKNLIASLSEGDESLDYLPVSEPDVFSIGGIELYDKEVFSQNNINLSFLKSSKILYKQFENIFIPNLFY